jgi:hypothetical protein
VAVKVLNRESVTGTTMARWREEVRAGDTLWWMVNSYTLRKAMACL